MSNIKRLTVSTGASGFRLTAQQTDEPSMQINFALLEYAHQVLHWLMSLCDEMRLGHACRQRERERCFG